MKEHGDHRGEEVDDQEAGAPEPFEYIDAESGLTTLGSSVPYTSPNLGGNVDTPGIWMPPRYHW